LQFTAPNIEAGLELQRQVDQLTVVRNVPRQGRQIERWPGRIQLPVQQTVEHNLFVRELAPVCLNAVETALLFVLEA
jgi:hypothetical protein